MLAFKDGKEGLMEQYSIKQVSEMLTISKVTLRYYDKLDLVSPARGENGYRTYSGQDVMDLKYIETLKYADFSLSEIRFFFSFRRSLASEEDCLNIGQLLNDKKTECQQKIEMYKSMIILVEDMLKVKDQIGAPNDMIKADALVEDVFEKMRSGYHDE
jgi:DNA-binding transcriptional MerR regulator